MSAEVEHDEDETWATSTSRCVDRYTRGGREHFVYEDSSGERRVYRSLNADLLKTEGLVWHGGGRLLR